MDDHIQAMGFGGEGMENKKKKKKETCSCNMCNDHKVESVPLFHNPLNKAIPLRATPMEVAKNRVPNAILQP